MSLGLQVVLILASIGMYGYVIRRIRQANIRIEDVIGWVLGSTVLLLMSIFPFIPMKLAQILGFMSASNFIFTSIIFGLLLMVFGQSLRMSHQQEQIKVLAHEIALMKHHAKDSQAN